jgi:hypothetical protein
MGMFAPAHADVQIADVRDTLSFVHEQRGSNELVRAYNDGSATAGVRFMFQ